MAIHRRHAAPAEPAHTRVASSSMLLRLPDGGPDRRARLPQHSPDLVHHRRGPARVELREGGDSTRPKVPAPDEGLRQGNDVAEAGRRGIGVGDGPTEILAQGDAYVEDVATAILNQQCQQDHTLAVAGLDRALGFEQLGESEHEVDVAQPLVLGVQFLQSR